MQDILPYNYSIFQRPLWMEKVGEDEDKLKKKRKELLGEIIFT